jgi:hypothetical protein
MEPTRPPGGRAEWRLAFPVAHSRPSRVRPRIPGEDRVGMVFPPSLCVRQSVNSSRGAVVADDRYDVIIGTGAGGGTLAQRLAATGKRMG